ncbi:hypothetical protein K503DRAFT_700117 [Rhizopogon vinicolor AM-OR11-026]|uniref:F-box domain-containing protein n=1 Tax=Rhizopogon vinicolor AM-OR11-026 TaxID=1314800 RepID=A0A1B7MM05_9AGAM|nr:hypothetical protein K503DRAFT_700117 [Rhizopogon vinicolor AM-OR11-026]
MGRPSANTFSVELAPELWLIIFDHLPPRFLHDVTLTCHSFRHLAQPLLFRSLTFCPYSLDMNNRRFIPRLETIEHTKQRIQFCSSSRIAHAVRECKLYPRYIVGAVHSDIASDVLLDILLDALPHFVNLRSLFLMFVDLSQSQMLKLCASRNIGNLLLGNCAVEHIKSLPPSKLQVADLTIVCDNQSRVMESGHGLSVFSPDHLRSVSIVNPTVASYFLNNFVANAPHGLLQLRSLTLPCEAEVVHAFSRLLPLVPELVDLKFCHLRPSTTQPHIPKEFTLTTFCPPVKPLSKYQGPRQLLPYFVRPGALEHLSLWSAFPVISDSSMDPVELHGALVGGNQLVSVCNKEVLKTVQKLELSVTHVDALVLDAVCARFPVLRSLYVYVGSSYMQAWNTEMILDALLTLPLPSTIQRLRLSAHCVTMPLARPATDYTEDRLARRKRDLQVKYPNLSFISLDEMDVNLTWDRSRKQIPT